MYKSRLWSIVWRRIHSKIIPEFVNQRKFRKYVNTCTFVAPVFQPWFNSYTFWSFWIFFLCFLSNKYYIMLLNFKRYLFSIITIFFIDEKGTQWNLDTKVKVFHESISCFMKCPWKWKILWNTQKENPCLYCFLFSQT